MTKHRPDNDHDQESGRMPNEFDRLMGNLDGLPDVAKTREVSIRVVPHFGIGGTETYLIQTYRQKDAGGDTIFLEHISAAGNYRLVIPAKVANVIARQRDQLTAKVRSKIAKANAAERKAQGFQPFVKKTGT